MSLPKITGKYSTTKMDEKYLKDKGLLEEANRIRHIMEYVTPTTTVNEVDANADGLDDATGMPPAAPGTDPAMGMGAPADPTMGAAPDPAMETGAPADPAAAAAPAAPDPAAGAPGFNPEGDEDAPATADQSVAEATPETGEGSGDEEVIDVDELVDGQKRNEDAITRLTDKFEDFLGKFQEFQGEIKSNAELMTKLEDEMEKRNPTSLERLTMRSLQSKPFQETPEEYMKYDAPENYSPEDDNNGVGEPRYTITRDDIRNATDYTDIAKTLRDNENSSLKTLLGL